MKPNLFYSNKPIDPFSMDHLLKMYFFHYHLLFLLILSIHIGTLYFEGNTNIAEFIFGAFLIVIVTAAVVFKLEYSILKHFVTPYLVIKIGALSFFLFMVWKASPETCTYFLLIPFGICNLFKFRTVVIWTLVILLLIVFITILPNRYYPDLMKYKNVHVNNIRILITFFTIGLFIIYYNIKISENKYRILVKSFENESLILEEKIYIENSQMYDSIYLQILDYFENSKPWKNSEFGMQDLAHQCNTNTSYISRAIKYNTDMNFKSFMNTYRINYIKEEMKINYPRYTLMHIYTSAGFKHQSTFNKAFKQVENMTPSEFMNSLEISSK
ncbi:helix-turn-helix domain-containing protein [Chryseobacterium viscerum]|uniref:HTH araC/xylS-type domain-containing protein n=1 Tax=Chryseobacterium viscerum TaxID=1037377 RepID=A0A316WMZ0_9FLAO|nr:AraC family transcriptional regulator [Chryseobacterium viscerum]PWN59880.1 hypothetical protein C1634_017825 [Chryseobacterium viscerum]